MTFVRALFLRKNETIEARVQYTVVEMPFIAKTHTQELLIQTPSETMKHTFFYNNNSDYIYFKNLLKYVLQRHLPSLKFP